MHYALLKQNPDELNEALQKLPQGLVDRYVPIIMARVMNFL